MKDYKQLAVRYLKMNRRRSLVTIFGAMIATMVIYCMLILAGVSYCNIGNRFGSREITRLYYLPKRSNRLRRSLRMTG